MNEPTTTPDAPDYTTFFTVTHPFHPLAGQELPLLTERVSYGERRVYYHDPRTHHLHSLPSAWTDRAAPEPFALSPAEPAVMPLSDLRQLIRLLQDWGGTHPSHTP